MEGKKKLLALHVQLVNPMQIIKSKEKGKKSAITKIKRVREGGK